MRKLEEKILEVKKKREFSKLPDSVALRALEICREDVKGARSFLRKYLGVFLTNRVLRADSSSEDVLKFHKSSKERDYEKFYRKIFEGVLDSLSPHVLDGEVLRTSRYNKSKTNKESGTEDGEINIIDIGCGVNGFSCHYIRDALGRDFNYVGIEASGQLVESTNKYFEEKEFPGDVLHGDLFDLDFVLKIVGKCEGVKIVFMFQVIDVLESYEKDFSKEFIRNVLSRVDCLVLSLPLVSLSGKSLKVKRNWVEDFLGEEFDVMKDFEVGSERVFVVRKK